MNWFFYIYSSKPLYDWELDRFSSIMNQPYTKVVSDNWVLYYNTINNADNIDINKEKNSGLFVLGTPIQLLDTGYSWFNKRDWLTLERYEELEEFDGNFCILQWDNDIIRCFKSKLSSYELYAYKSGDYTIITTRMDLLLPIKETPTNWAYLAKLWHYRETSNNDSLLLNGIQCKDNLGIEITNQTIRYIKRKNKIIGSIESDADTIIRLFENSVFLPQRMEKHGFFIDVGADINSILAALILLQQDKPWHFIKGYQSNPKGTITQVKNLQIEYKKTERGITPELFTTLHLMNLANDNVLNLLPLENIFAEIDTQGGLLAKTDSYTKLCRMIKKLTKVNNQIESRQIEDILIRDKIFDTEFRSMLNQYLLLDNEKRKKDLLEPNESIVIEGIDFTRSDNLTSSNIWLDSKVANFSLSNRISILGRLLFINGQKNEKYKFEKWITSMRKMGRQLGSGVFEGHWYTNSSKEALLKDKKKSFLVGNREAILDHIGSNNVMTCTWYDYKRIKRRIESYFKNPSNSLADNMIAWFKMEDWRIYLERRNGGRNE